MGSDDLNERIVAIDHFAVIEPNMDNLDSVESLSVWFEDKPIDFAQVIAARAALRVLPAAFAPAVSDRWVSEFALPLFRASWLTWSLRIKSRDELRSAKQLDGARAAADAAFVARAAARDADANEPLASAPSDAVANAADASRADAYKAFAIKASVATITDTIAFDELWNSINDDRNWMEERPIPGGAANFLAVEKLWLPSAITIGGEKITIGGSRITISNIPPALASSWIRAKSRLLSLEPSFNVWTDWYERRLLGEHFAYDLPSEADEAVQYRIIEADQTFWNQAAVDVNTAIRRWIYEANAEVLINECIKKLHDGMPTNLGTSSELNARGEFRDQLVKLIELGATSHGGIGHNQPPEEIDPNETFGLPPLLQDEAEIIAEELSKDEPNVAAIAEKISILNRAIQRLEKMGGIISDKFAESYGLALGTSAGVATTALIVLIWTDLLPKVMSWLASVI